MDARGVLQTFVFCACRVERSISPQHHRKRLTMNAGNVLDQTPTAIVIILMSLLCTTLSITDHRCIAKCHEMYKNCLDVCLTGNSCKLSTDVCLNFCIDAQMKCLSLCLCDKLPSPTVH